MKYLHLRFHGLDSITPGNSLGVSNLGGVTIAYNDEGWTYAICRENENFCRRQGRQVCDDRFAVKEYYPRKDLIIDEMINRVYDHIEKAPWYNKLVNHINLPPHARLKWFLY